MNKTLYINKAGLTTNLNWLAGFLNHQQPTVVSNALNLKGLVLDSKTHAESKFYAKCCHAAVKGIESAEVLGNSIGEPHMTLEKNK